MKTCIVLVFLGVCECNALELCESDHVGAAFKFINHKRMPATIWNISKKMIG